MYSIIFKLQILFLISFTQTSLKYYLTRNYPQDLDLKDDKEPLQSGKKRTLSETEDSLIITQR